MSRRKTRMEREAKIAKKKVEKKEDGKLSSKLAGRVVSQRDMLLKNLAQKRLEARLRDADELYKMNQAETLDTTKLGNTEYHRELARELGWSLSRFEKALKVFGFKP